METFEDDEILPVEMFEVDKSLPIETFEVDESFVSESGQFDITLIVEKHKIHVSKTVLCIASPVFRAMFRSDFKEKTKSEIQLPGKYYNDIVSFMNCIYPDRIANVTSDTVYMVLPLAVEYQVNALIKKCHEFLIQHVKSKHLNNAMEICRHIQISEKYNLGDLKQKSISIASEFPLGKFEEASKWYQITDDSLIKVHIQARMREELDRNDDKSVFFDQANIQRIKEKIIFEFKTHIYRHRKYKPLQLLRFCYRHFKDDQQLFEEAIEYYKRFERNNFEFDEDQMEFDVEKELFLLPEMLKQSLKLN